MVPPPMRLATAGGLFMSDLYLYLLVCLCAMENVPLFKSYQSHLHKVKSKGFLAQSGGLIK